MFTYIIDELITAYTTCKDCFKRQVSPLGRDHILFLNECLRFSFYAYLFYNTEEVIQGFFNKIKGMMSNRKAA